MKTVVLLIALSVLAGCGGGGVTPMRVETRTSTSTVKSQDDLNREMIDAAKKRERMSARGV